MAVGAHHGTFTLWEDSSGTITSAVLVCFCLAGVPWPAHTCVTQSSWPLKTISTWTAGGTLHYLSPCTTAHHDRARLAELLGAAYSTTKASHRETNLWGFFSVYALNIQTYAQCFPDKTSLSHAKMVTYFALWTWTLLPSDCSFLFSVLYHGWCFNRVTSAWGVSVWLIRVGHTLCFTATLEAGPDESD